jgi:hypothetical protein
MGMEKEEMGCWRDGLLERWVVGEMSLDLCLMIRYPKWNFFGVYDLDIQCKNRHVEQHIYIYISQYLLYSY